MPFTKCSEEPESPPQKHLRRAFGADFSSQFPPVSSFTATLTLDDGEIFQFTAPTDPNYAFFGFISSLPIRDLTFSDGGILRGLVNLHEELIGNIYMVTVIPEPATIALAAIGALLLGWRWRRRC